MDSALELDYLISVLHDNVSFDKYYNCYTISLCGLKLIIKKLKSYDFLPEGGQNLINEAVITLENYKTDVAIPEKGIFSIFDYEELLYNLRQANDTI